MKNIVDMSVDRVKGYGTNIQKNVIENSNFITVLYTSLHNQVVMMNLKEGEETGEQIHKANDQFFRIESGRGVFIVNGFEYNTCAGDAIMIPAGAKHRIINKGTSGELKTCTIFSPPHYKDGFVRTSKAEAEDFPEVFDGVTTE